jgi:vitamin B12/bleomycin/antimicrobial peptide transport system ATP-binding/permease protein
MSFPNQTDRGLQQKRLVSRYWQSASGFWRGPTARISWGLTVFLIIVVILELTVKYRLNFWNRDFFNALEQRDEAAIWKQALVFVPIVLASTSVAMLGVWGRMTAQRKWRQWLTEKLITLWLADSHYRALNQTAGDHQNPEYRIAEDVRQATDAPVNFAFGLLSAVLTAIIFIDVLWSVGGNLVVETFGTRIELPGYLVIAVALYTLLTTTSMVLIGARMVDVIERMDQAEAQLRYEGTHLREDGGEGANVAENKTHSARALWAAVAGVIARWYELCIQLVRTTLISHGNAILAPVVPLLLCAPKYLVDAMSLGEVVQAASAFVAVQAAFNWITDNYPSIAGWTASVHRVASLLYSLDGLEDRT